MTRFVVSDHHFDHENIIEYCNRPFSSVDEMNNTMIKNWNRVVDSTDVVIHVGDVAFSNSDRAEEILNKLNGQIMITQGNHDDSISPESFPYPVVESTIYQNSGYRFWCTHRYENVPDDWTQWVIHGHVHNDEPFVDYANNKINVSVEQINYTPIPINQIVKMLQSMNVEKKIQNIQNSNLRDHQWYQNNLSF